MRNLLRKLCFLAVLLAGAVCSQAKSPAKPPVESSDKPATPAVMTRIDSLWELRKSRLAPVPDRALALPDVKTPRSEIGKKLFRIPEHPMLDSLRTPEREREILAAINRRCDSLGRDSLTTADLFYVMRPYFGFLFHEDPHYRIFRQIPIDPDDKKAIKDFYKNLRQPAFNTLCIGDTLLVNRSLDPLFRPGDRVLSINGVPVSEFLRCGYSERYPALWQVMQGYNLCPTFREFRIELIRDGERIEVTTPGQAGRKASFALRMAESMDNNIRTFADAGCGYIAIPEFFPVNSRLIRIVHKTILDFKRQGLTNVILDLRRNPGGNGDAFDCLMSIFIDKPVVQNIRQAWVKGSPQARQVYDFLTPEQDGQRVPMPDGEFVREFATIPKMYVGGMKYYVLMSKDTGSVAATFCNMLQYNDAAKLVGEPLLHNALRYGEVIDGRVLLPTLLYPTAVSITEFDEYTRAVDGVLIPDIPIPYVAADHLDGRDAVLEKLLSLLAPKAG